uniref:Ubiquitin-like domain-containing protein n=1 Tax=viral metagenome TaxID=1070528 RepID=A0A6C0AWY8_9ZZZZ|tara:strand:+ start:104 stop:400 length:297 start_codon:yes stop_codon:yes gene_type:complete
MHLLIRDNESIKTIDTNEDWTLNDLKEKIEDITFLPANLIYLTCNSKVLQMGSLDNQLEDNDFIDVMLELKGGMRAKWRKKRMRRMRRQRRKMRQRAR